ncbi:MAG: tRNA lysidine(34) synthetase TilS [Bacteroidetes bacterium]|nr:tRNA lysidine(34) synthetase TilS [Bacteroidota bacterium]
MEDEFLHNISLTCSATKKHKLLLAISGGADSVVLAHLLKKHHFTFEMAHCNFSLRGKDSAADELFCKKLSDKLNVNLHISKFNTKKYAAEQKLSIQMAARELRYNWFNTLIATYNFDYLLTAHHLNDSVETFFINLLRGSGLKGIKGITLQNNNVLRPLTTISRLEIEQFAHKHNIAYCTDKSNFEDKYERNFIRLNIIPLLQKINTNAEQQIAENLQNFNNDYQLLSELITFIKPTLLTIKNNSCKIDKVKLFRLSAHKILLFYLVKDYGFNFQQTQKIIASSHSLTKSGQTFFTKTHLLVNERAFFEISELTTEKEVVISFTNYTQLKKHFTIKKNLTINPCLKNEIILNKNSLIYPLLIRNAKTGDKFVPFGNSFSKKISDYYKEQKLSYHEKQNTQLLINGDGKIIWVIGHRSDERFKVKSTKNLIKLTLKK